MTECLECEGRESMRVGTCSCCGRTLNIRHKGGVCNLCWSVIPRVMLDGNTEERATEIIKQIAQGLYFGGSGYDFEKDYFRWKLEHGKNTTDKENLTVDKGLTGEKLKIVHVDPPEDIKLTDFQPLEIIPDPEIVISLAGEPEIARLWAEAPKRTQRTLRAAILNIIEAELEVAK